MINDGKPMVDENGEPVRYGDIIYIDVEWSTCNLCVRDGHDRYILWNKEWYTGRTSDGKKVGNIWDNPELMCAE